MKNLIDVLKSLGLQKNTQNLKVAKNYVNFISFVNEIKKDITSVNVLDFEKLEAGFRDRASDEMYNVFELEFLRTVQIFTTYGSYNICVPTNTNYYSYLCVLLQIECSYTPEVENVTAQNTMYIDSNILESIVKAVKFTDTKKYLDIAKNIYLKFENDFCNVLATNGTVIYKSQKFDFISDHNFESLTLSIPVEFIADFKNSKNEFLKIDLIRNDKVLINGNEIYLSDENGQKFETFNFDVNGKMNFCKTTLEKNLKGFKSSLDHRKLLKFHLNGAIEVEGQNISPEIKTNLKMNYINKNFSDSDFIFKYDDIMKILANFKNNELTFSPNYAGDKQRAVITDYKDTLLIQSQKTTK